MVQWLGPHTVTAEGLGSIPGGESCKSNGTAKKKKKSAQHLSNLWNLLDASFYTLLKESWPLSFTQCRLPWDQPSMNQLSNPLEQAPDHATATPHWPLSIPRWARLVAENKLRASTDSAFGELCNYFTIYRNVIITETMHNKWHACESS